jgi:hypothetical protein
MSNDDFSHTAIESSLENKSVLKLAPPNGVSSKADFSFGFEGGNLSTAWEWGKAQYQEPIQGEPDRLSTIDKNSIPANNNGDPNGEKALNVTVLPNDKIENGARAEVVLANAHLPVPPWENDRYWFNPGEDTWYHWYTLFPSNLKIPDSWHVWTQWHGENLTTTCHRANGSTFPCGVVPMGFNLRNYPVSNPEDRTNVVGETLEFRVLNKTDKNQDPSPWNPGNPRGLGYGDDILWTTWNDQSNTNSFQSDHWYEFLLHVKWQPCGNYSLNGTCTQLGPSTDPNTWGFVEMWIDGKNVVPKTYHFTMDDDARVYLKQGLYHCHPDSHSRCPATDVQIIYHDGMTVAECPQDSMYYHPNTHECYHTPPYQ